MQDPDTPQTFSQDPDGFQAPGPESEGLSAIGRWVGLSLALGALGAGVVYALTLGVEEVAEARAELLIRYGYEYTPPSLGSSSDSMQVRIDPDTALANEVQILSSRPVLEAALAAVPHPGRPAPDRPVPLGVADLLEQVSISPVEGSSVVGLSVTDADPDWALAFTGAMIEAYRTRRADLFGSEQAVAALRSNRDVLAGRLEETLDLLSEEIGRSAAPLLRTGAGPRSLEPVLQDWAETGIDLVNAVDDPSTGLPDQQASIDEVRRSLRRLLSLPGPALASSSSGEGELVRTLLDLRDDTVDALSRTERMLDSVALHGLMSERVEILSSPALVAQKGGLERWQRVLLAAVLATAAGLSLGLFVEGSRRRA